ncbi:hypothetical protein CBFG_01324 [Clostridiales bacterium 1_7_47FAA]|nr:hypothetical protein CBFG_01324 [Clostridiales bacterium 1_7_47FAA]
MKMLREFLILILPFLRTLHPSCVRGFFIMDCPHEFHPPQRTYILSPSRKSKIKSLKPISISLKPSILILPLHNMPVH